jgi:hypothetical protein
MASFVHMNKVVVADEPGYSTTEIAAIRPFLKLCPDYCALAFRRPDFVAYVERLGRGTKMPRLRTPDAIVAVFPLPPLAEQHRIVAKVDELMALCDRLKAARQNREATRGRLAAATLARLDAPNPETFRDDARFALDGAVHTRCARCFARYICAPIAGLQMTLASSGILHWQVGTLTSKGTAKCHLSLYFRLVAARDPPAVIEDARL